MIQVWFTRPFRYDLNQIPNDYTVEMTNRFKGLDLIEYLKNYGVMQFVMTFASPGFPDSSVCKESAIQRPRFTSWVWMIRWRRGRLPTPVFLGFRSDSADKESACNVGDLGSISGLGKSYGEGKGYPLQYSGLENSLDYIVYAVAKSWKWLSNFYFHFASPETQQELSC